MVAGALLLLRAVRTEHVDVVVAHYQEDLSWVDDFASSEVHFQVYTKGDRPSRMTVAMLPNVGRESHTYLHHIVENYDRLANWTVFTQGQKPAWGYYSGDSRSGHLTDHIRFGDYLVPHPGGADAFFAISAAAHLPWGTQSTRLGILTDRLKVVSNGLCPADGADGWSAWWLDEAHPHHRAGREMVEFYHRQVRRDAAAAELFSPVTLGFAQGARFAVARERIRSRPRAYYAALRRAVSSERDPLAGYFLEAMWYDVFHPESDQSRSPLCPYQALPSDVAAIMGATEMYSDTARRLNSRGVVDGVVRPRAHADAPGEPLADGYLADCYLADGYLADAYCATPGPPSPTPAPTSAPTPAPTLAPTPAPTPAPNVSSESLFVTGSLTLLLAEPATAFCTNTAMLDSIKKVFGAVLALDTEAVGISSCKPGVGGRSSAQHLGRRTSSSSVVVTYNVTIRADDAEVRLEALEELTPDLVQRALARQFGEDGFPVTFSVLEVGKPTVHGAVMADAMTTTMPPKGTGISGAPPARAAGPVVALLASAALGLAALLAA